LLRARRRRAAAPTTHDHQEGPAHHATDGLPFVTRSAGDRPGRCDRKAEGRPMIEVIHFTKHYGDFVAVEDLSFSIGKGEIFGFIGPNGAGKSTTIRFLATLLRPTAGEGRVAGYSVTAEPMSVRRVI